MISINPNKGFTLVELLVVIAIIAILGAVAAPLTLKQVQKSRISSILQTNNAIIKASGIYYADTALLPSTGNLGFQDLTENNGAVGWNGPYVSDRIKMATHTMVHTVS